VAQTENDPGSGAAGSSARRAPASGRQRSHGRGFGWLRIPLIAVLGLLLCALVIRHSLAGYLVRSSPELALWIAPEHPGALLAIAEARLDARPPMPEQGRRPVAAPATPESRADAELPTTATPLDTEEAAAISKLAVRALRSDLGSARALRILGQVAGASGDQQAAMRLMKMAARRSLRESVAVYLMLLRSYLDKDFDAALTYADALMRTRYDLAEATAPALARMAEDPVAAPKLQAVLAAEPPWRSFVLERMNAAISEPRTPLRLLLNLKGTASPPTPQEIRQYLEFLVRRNAYELAYYAWLQLLPSDQLAVVAPVFNGSFDFQPTGMPFDWTIKPGFGVTVGVGSAPDSDGNKGLRVEFGAGRVELGDVSQRLMLAPGPYELRFKYRGEVTGRRGLRWVVACAAEVKSTLVETQPFLGTQRAWRSTQASFQVPAEGCASQTIRLVHDARSSSEQFVSGLVWYDDIAISRLRGE